jgi:hypothetical protein
MDTIYITRPGEETVIDSIPLAEAEKITNSESLENGNIAATKRIIFNKDRNGMACKIYPDVSADMSTWNIRSTFKKSQNGKVVDRAGTSLFGSLKAEREESKAMLQINTIPDGFNSGYLETFHSFVFIALLSKI